MYEILKTEKFAVLFSFMIGFGITVMMIPICKGDACFIKKAPTVEEMKGSTFRLGSKCYQFKPEFVDCPTEGAIEAFSLMG